MGIASRRVRSSLRNPNARLVLLLSLVVVVGGLLVTQKPEVAAWVGATSAVVVASALGYFASLRADRIRREEWALQRRADAYVELLEAQSRVVNLVRSHQSLLRQHQGAGSRSSREAVDEAFEVLRRAEVVAEVFASLPVRQAIYDVLQDRAQIDHRYRHIHKQLDWEQWRDIGDLLQRFHADLFVVARSELVPTSLEDSGRPTGA